jgi:uncharacterized SAM-binding protein YcdF (DUF218 family)
LTKIRIVGFLARQFLAKGAGMSLELLLPSGPLILALIIWWLRFRRTGRLGCTLSIFLFGYLLLLASEGWQAHVRELASSRESLLWFLLGETLAAYVLGGLGMVGLAAVCSLRNLTLFRTDEVRLRLSAEELMLDQDATQPHELGAVLEFPEEVRRLAIEECAEHAYEFIVQKGLFVTLDRDRAEIIAGELRDSLLALGFEGRNYAG